MILKIISLIICILTLLLWTQTYDQWVLVTSFAWLIVFTFAEDIVNIHRKKKQ